MTEHQHTEWKESWRDRHLKWIAGFANAQGGALVLGKNDAGKVVGVADAKRLLLLTKYLRAGISYQGSQRHERFPVPESALREALINAIAHKDYGSGIPIQISVYDDKLMIWNPGQLPVDWSLGRLLAKHASQPANPDIANAFFLAGKIESWGRGVGPQKGGHWKILK